MLPTEPTQQFALNVVVPVFALKLDALRAVLERISDETRRTMAGEAVVDELMPFERVESLHYARWVLIDAASAHPKLAFTTHYDGPVATACTEPMATERHFTQLLEAGRAAFDAVYACCEGYPGAGASNAAVIEYLLSPQHTVQAAAFYCGSRGRSRDQIRAEAALRRRASEWLDQQTQARTLPSDPRQIRSAMVAALGPIPPFPPQPDGTWKLVLLGGALVTAGLTAWPITFSLVPAAVGLLGLLRYKEATDVELEPLYNASERKHVGEMAADENLFLQNALSNVVEIKPGPFRRTLLRAVLLVIDFLAKNYFVHGKLDSIPSIHFAHWYLIDGGKRLAFVSNFDSSWESYLGDFIDQESSGLTAIWSNSVGYPRTEFLVRAGARAGEQFKAWARHIQVPTQVWYSAYPALSVLNINDNTLIRRGLADASIDPSEWLAKLT